MRLNFNCPPIAHKKTPHLDVHVYIHSHSKLDQENKLIALRHFSPEPVIVEFFRLGLLGNMKT